jgi:hypothetical protein
MFMINLNLEHNDSSKLFMCDVIDSNDRVDERDYSVVYVVNECAWYDITNVCGDRMIVHSTTSFSYPKNCSLAKYVVVMNRGDM